LYKPIVAAPTRRESGAQPFQQVALVKAKHQS
jgi:hypothetical protein